MRFLLPRLALRHLLYVSDNLLDAQHAVEEGNLLLHRLNGLIVDLEHHIQMFGQRVMVCHGLSPFTQSDNFPSIPYHSLPLDIYVKMCHFN